MAELAARRISRLSAHVLQASPAASSGFSARFSGQVCIVTGAARGIGLAVALRLAREGARAVCIFDVGDGSGAVSALKATGIEAECKNVELTSESAVSGAVAEVVKSYGKVDVLVCAAGITGKTNVKTHEVDVADFTRVFDVNVKALFLCAKAVLPSMLKEGYGRIVNIASISGKEGNAGMLAYSASKAAVINMTKVIGKDYVNMGKDITVNCIAPAVVRTAMVDAMPPEQVKYMTDKIPMSRTGSVDEVASTVCFAASPECSFTTGFCFDASGGRTVY
jgi:3-oxoacyl-[acyl-carrier protein] reductase